MRTFLLWVPLVALAAATCGRSDGNLQPGATLNGSGPASGSGGSLVGQNCDPPCAAPQFCSVIGECLDSGKCGDDDDCQDGAECTAAGECGGCAPPNLLIVLDRSCSMTGMVAGQTKWEIAVAAIDKLTSDYLGEIRFGLTLFPDSANPDCQQDVPAIPVAPDNETAVQTLLGSALMPSDPNFPNNPCVTNIDTAMEQAAAEPAFDDTERESYALLITDGKQYGCNAAGGDAGTTQIITDLFQTRGVATFVVGFGAGVDPAQLNVFADAGGVPTSDPSCMPDACRFYKAEDGQSLDAALAAIAKQVSCGGTVD